MKLGFTDADNPMGIGTRPLEGALFQAATMSERPSMDLRMSVTPETRKTLPEGVIARHPA
ncbi:hypothetical protein [Shewanella sp.]|uniref:hypothetical protein n=1 Tax=Shewanella sp. TaxID=50422 RepID=UPI0040540FF8